MVLKAKTAPPDCRLVELTKSALLMVTTDCDQRAPPFPLAPQFCREWER